MFKLSHKNIIIRTSIFCGLIIAVLSMATFFIANQSKDTKAAISPGDLVKITRKPDTDTYHYGSSGDGSYSRWYVVTAPDGTVYEAFCAQASRDDPRGSNRTALELGNDTNNGARIKLMNYIWLVNNANTATLREQIFGLMSGGDWSDSGAAVKRYLFTHAVISGLYADDYHGLNTQEKNSVKDAATYLLDSIAANSPAWQEASRYTLFYAVPVDNDDQVVTWIAESTAIGGINVKKCDYDTGACTPQGGATFEGIPIEVRNATGGDVYNPANGVTYPSGAVMASGTLDANGQVSFSNLPANNITYQVVETASNTSYQLTAPSEQTVVLSSDGQVAEVTFYDAVRRGNLTVNKIDGLTGSCTHASGAISFAGTSFKLTNSTGKSITYGGRTIVNGDVVDTKTLTASSCNAVFENLPYGTYTLQETSASNGYTANTTAPRTITIPTSDNYSVSTSFTNQPIIGSIKINKTDKETGTCTTVTSKHSFAGTTFQLINNTGGSVYYNNTFIAQGGVIATKTMSEGNCDVTFTNLPYGNYQIKETRAGSRYYLDPTIRNVTVPTNNQKDITVSISNQPIRGDLRFIKKDPANNIPMENAYFSISSIDENNHIMETHIVVTDRNGVVDTRSSFNLHSNHTNGYDELYDSSEVPMVYSGYGSWFGLNRNNQPVPVDDSVGALPYGTYIVQELRCDANMFCSDIINQKVTFTINSHNQVVDLGDWNNTCAQFSIETEATDESDNDHYIEEGEDAVIKDHISYCAKKNYTFTITGTLMDKSTGEPLVIDGQTFEQTMEVKPTTDCDTLDMEFPINTADLGGKEIVVFEHLYYKGSLKTKHEDIEDANQTITIVKLGTVATDNEDDDHFIIEGDRAIIKDTVSYCAKKDIPYVIKGILMDKETGGPLYINDETIEQSVEITPTENCGTAELLFELDNTTGLAGRAIVAYETLYRIIPTEPVTYEKIISHEDPNDEDQTVTVINYGTYAINEQSGDKLFPRDADIAVKDTVRYCLQPGKEYTVKGVVMDKETGNELLINNAPVQSEVTFTPTEACGETEMYFRFNTSNLGGAKLVIFEGLYFDDNLLLEHRDLDNSDESFEVDLNAPDTGYAARMSTGTTETKHIELLIISIASIVPITIYSGYRLLNKRKIGFKR